MWRCVTVMLLTVILIAVVSLVVVWSVKWWHWCLLSAVSGDYCQGIGSICASTCDIVPSNTFRTSVIIIKRLLWLADLYLTIPYNLCYMKYECSFFYGNFLSRKLEGTVYVNYKLIHVARGLNILSINITCVRDGLLACMCYQWYISNYKGF